MIKLASFFAVGLVLATAACEQAPTPPQAPRSPTPPPMGSGPPSEEMDHGQMMMMHHMGDMARHDDTMRGEHARGRRRGGEGMHRGGEGDREVMGELAMLGVHFYPPPMLLKRAQKIGLTQDQIVKIRQEVLTAQARSVDLKAKLEKAKVESIRLLAVDKVDQRAVDAQIDEATKVAAELRKLHLGVMLRVRDLLTPEQLKKLEEHKPRNPDAKPNGPGPGRQAMDDDDDDDDDDEED